MAQGASAVTLAAHDGTNYYICVVGTKSLVRLLVSEFTSLGQAASICPQVRKNSVFVDLLGRSARSWCIHHQLRCLDILRPEPDSNANSRCEVQSRVSPAGWNCAHTCCQEHRTAYDCIVAVMCGPCARTVYQISWSLHALQWCIATMKCRNDLPNTPVCMTTHVLGD